MALSKPFAVNGNKVDIPLNKTDDGTMNYDEGFGVRYEQPIKAVIDEKGNITSTGGLQITRPQFNGLMNELSKAIIENQEKSANNFQLINNLANVVSGAAFLAKDNTFTGTNTFKSEVTFSSAIFAVNPNIESPLAYSAMTSDSLITKRDLEAQISHLKSVISAMASNINGGNASFDTLKVKHLIVSSGASVISGSANTATTTTFTDSGLHLVKFKNFKN